MREDVPGYEEGIFLAMIVKGWSGLRRRAWIELVFDERKAIVAVLRKSSRGSAGGV